MATLRIFIILWLVGIPTFSFAQGLPWSWGRNNQGQLGDGGSTDSNVPIGVAFPVRTVAMAGGYQHSLRLDTRTTVQAWGDNAFGQLGDGTYIDHAVPDFVLDANGSCCLSNVIAIAAGEMHSLALKSDGTVWAWGNNFYGQLGDGTGVSSAVPVQVPIDGIIAIAAGYLHSVALAFDGTVWTWGSNQFGQLGDGSFANRLLPYRVQSLRRVRVDAIAAGGAHTLAKVGGRVLAWGDNGEGQLGNGTINIAGQPTPTWVLDPTGSAPLADAVAIGAGGRHSLAVREAARTVWSWGSDTYGQLGDGSCNAVSTLPVQSGTITEIMQVAGGDAHSLARRIDGVVFAWGHDHFGQLGNANNGWFMCGPVGIIAGPVSVTLQSGAQWIAAGGFHSLAVR